MYIECFNNHGKQYLRIMKNFYTGVNGKIKVTRKTIKNLGYLEKFDDGEPNFLERFRHDFKTGKISFEGVPKFEEKDENEKTTVTLEFRKEDFILNPKNIGYLVLNKIYNDLGIFEILNKHKSNSKIEYDLNGLTKLLVFNRILDPSSKKRTFQTKEDYLFSITSSNNLKEIYRALDVLNENAEAIQTRINTKIKKSTIEREATATYYDVTNYYFETMYSDEDEYELDENGEPKLDDSGKKLIKKQGSRKKGVSKENKPNPIVQMGLFIDNNGLPISYKLFPGNTQDKTTFKEIIKTSFDNKKLGRVIVVADNGINAQENMYLLLINNNGYIISKSVKKSWSNLKEWALDTNDYKVIKNSSNEIVFKFKSRIYKRTLIDKEGNSITIDEKEILFWSRKHYERELFQNQKFIEYLESCKKNPDKLKDKQRKSKEFTKAIQTDPKTGEILKTKEVIVILDEKIKKYQETMGFYSIVTSETEMDDREVINRYRGLSRIEDSFRIIKSDLEGRPVYVKKSEHINAHFLICFIALIIIRIIQYKILIYENKPTLNTEGWTQGITADKIKRTLKNFKVEKLPNSYYKITKIDNELETILKALNINYDFKNYTREDIIKFRKNINNMVL